MPYFSKKNIENLSHRFFKSSQFLSWGDDLSELGSSNIKMIAMNGGLDNEAFFNFCVEQFMQTHKKFPDLWAPTLLQYAVNSPFWGADIWRKCAKMFPHYATLYNEKFPHWDEETFLFVCKKADELAYERLKRLPWFNDSLFCLPFPVLNYSSRGVNWKDYE